MSTYNGNTEISRAPKGVWIVKNNIWGLCLSQLFSSAHIMQKKLCYCEFYLWTQKFELHHWVIKVADIIL